MPNDIFSQCPVRATCKQPSIIKIVDMFVAEMAGSETRIFNSNELIDHVRNITGRPRLQDGTIMRRLREMRERHTIKFIGKGNYELV